MVIRVDMSAPELDQQIELLKVYPEVLEKHFAPVLKRDVKALAAAIRPMIPRLSGRAQRSFGSKVTGKGVNLTGQVGWYDRGDPWYPNVLEYGAKAHEMNTFVPRLSKRIKTHPGLSAMKFMETGYKSLESTINAELAQANEAVVNELALR